MMQFSCPLIGQEQASPKHATCLPLTVNLPLAPQTTPPCDVWSPKTMILGIGYSLKVNEVVIGLYITITMITISHRNWPDCDLESNILAF